MWCSETDRLVPMASLRESPGARCTVSCVLGSLAGCANQGSKGICPSHGNVSMQ
jgi:hypothetical protein